MVGIVSYGTYIPKYRIKISDIARVWGKEGEEVSKSLGILEKSVPAQDEDAVTLAVSAAQNALVQGKIDPIEIKALLVGSESHPYAVNPTSTTVGEFLGIGNNYLSVDLQFACKAATAGIQLVSGLVETGRIKSGLVIGTDTAQSKPHDILEYTSAAAAAAFVIGKEKIIAKLVDHTSYSSDTPDFWRRDGIRYPSHAGRFTGKPAYYSHVMSAARALFDKSKTKPADFDYCVFHMPNGKFPQDVAKKLDFTAQQLQPSLVVSHLGNPYSASSLIGLAAVLDQAKPGEKIFMVSYGSGAGSDGFVWQVTDQIQNSQFKINNFGSVRSQIDHKSYIDYTQYLKQTHKI